MITVVGGTYEELCFEPYWKQIYGSGLRACQAINALAPDQTISFFTFGDEKIESHLNVLAKFTKIESAVTRIEHSIQFYYDHPLINPRIFPRSDTIAKSENNFSVEAENTLYYGFFEGSACVKGNKVVYDPQSPIAPVSFTATNSTAKELAYVINLREAKIISKKFNINEIKEYFFQVEQVRVLVLKMGPKGALVSTPDGKEQIIPVYKTDNVWPIGSGDIFAAVFAYNWFNNNDVFNAAQEASWQTACYCNFKDFEFHPINSIPSFIPLKIEKFPINQIYLAGPFFTFSERWLIDQIRNALNDFHLKVFSPWHDVGHGIASEVVYKDLEALDASAIVFSVLDGLDSGTLFEIGYTVKKGIPIIGYVENETSESTKMLEGTSCILEKDLTTAIYKCFWQIAENE